MTVVACNVTSDLQDRSTHVTLVAATPVITPTKQPAIPPSPTPLSGELEVHSVTGSARADGAWVVVGLISNGTDADYIDVQVSVEAIDMEGNSIQSEIGPALVSQLPSGGEIPFRVIGFENASSAARFQAQVDQVIEADLIQPELEIIESTLVVDDEDGAHILGRVVNHSDLAVTLAGIAVAIFDSELIAADTAQVWIGHLDPGEDGPFRASIPFSGFDPSGVLTHRVYLDAQFSAMAQGVALDLSSPFNYRDQSGGFHLVGELTNAHTGALHARLIGAIYDTEGNLIDAAFVDPVPSLDPLESIPFDLSNWGPLNTVAGLHERAETFIIQWDPLWTFESENPAAKLSVDSLRSESSEGGLIVRGSVQNDSSAGVGQVHLIAGVREISSGVLQGVGTELIGEIDIGGQLSFEVFVPLEPGFDASGLDIFVIAKGVVGFDL